MFRQVLSISKNINRVKHTGITRRANWGALGHMSIAIGGIGTYYTLQQVVSPSKIANDSMYGNSVNRNATFAQAQGNGVAIQQKSWVSRNLNYDELTIGSVTGLFLGIIAGKLSSVIVFLTLSAYLLTQYLESRGIINIPWSAAINIGKEKMDVKSLVFDKVSFKIAFVSSFLIAAFNV